MEPIPAQLEQEFRNLLLEFSEGSTLASDSENEEEFCVENLGKLIVTYQN